MIVLKHTLSRFSPDDKVQAPCCQNDQSYILYNSPRACEQAVFENITKNEDMKRKTQEMPLFWKPNRLTSWRMLWRAFLIALGVATKTHHGNL